MSYFPQALLLDKASTKPPGERSKQNPTSTLIRSDIGIQKFSPLAKLTGAYIPENLMSAVSNRNRAKTIDENFVSLENHKLSSLVPEIRIYRRDDSGRVTPFYFPVVSDFEFDGTRINQDKTFASNSAVIESFSVTYTGKNPFQASKKFLEASLTIKIDNISTLFNVPAGDLNSYAPLAHLFLIRVEKGAQQAAGMKKSKPPSVFEGGDACNIVVSLGYANHQSETLSPNEMRIIEENRMLINLFYASHDLSMEPDGSATLSAKYTGFLSANKGNTFFDLITPVPSKTKLLRDKAPKDKKAKKDIKNVEKTDKEKEDEKKAKLTKEEEVRKSQIPDINDKFKRIFDNLFNLNKVHTASSNNFYAEKSIIAPIKKKKGEEPKKKPKTTAQGVAQKSDSFFNSKMPDKAIGQILNKGFIHYITFGDFFDSYLKVIGEDLQSIPKELKKTLEETKKKSPKSTSEAQKSYDSGVKEVAKLLQRLKKITFLMADFKFSLKTENSDPHSQTERSMNVADIPIAIDTIYTLVYDELISTRKPWLDITNFVEDFCMKLLTMSFGQLPGADFLRDVTFNITSFSGQPSANKIKKGEMQLLDLSKPTGSTSKKAVQDLNQFYIIHQKPPLWSRSVGEGNKKNDLGKGIFHLRASQDRGIVKSISFSRISQPARETYMIFRNGQLYDELRYPHNANIEMVGNNLFLPGSAVYINPDTLGFGDPRGIDSIARRLGFGGYYIAGNITTTFSAGGLTTSMQLYFNSFPEVGNTQSNLSDNIKRSIKELNN
tara:strand:+ start:1341 stop:3668 length:2328 start_codon:yes stop_codon:yes gene_type:complete